METAMALSFASSDPTPPEHPQGYRTSTLYLIHISHLHFTNFSQRTTVSGTHLPVSDDP